MKKNYKSPCIQTVELGLKTIIAASNWNDGTITEENEIDLGI